MRTYTIPVLVAFFSASCFSAERDTCKIPTYIAQDIRAVNMANGQCKCAISPAESKYPYEMPKHFRMVAFCGHPAFGPFYFEGTQRVSGYITRMETVTFGDFMELYIGEGMRGDGLPNRIDGLPISFRFYSQEKAIRNFHPPRLTTKVTCWKAPAVVDVYKFNRDFDSSDASGDYLHTYRVVSLGKYQRCKGEPA